MKRQQGFALIMAIAMLVLAGLLSSVVLRLSQAGGHGAVLSLQEIRAMSAARSGLEWGLYRVLNGKPCENVSFGLAPVAQTGFTVQLQCAASLHRSGNDDFTLYRFNAIATFGTFGSAVFVRREMSAVFIDE